MLSACDKFQIDVTCTTKIMNFLIDINLCQIRKHSSGMCAARLPTYVFWWLPLGVSTGGGYPRSQIWGWVGIPWDLGYPSPDILTSWTYPPLGHTDAQVGDIRCSSLETCSPPSNRMTDTCENITSHQLRWRAVKSVTYLYV